MVENPIVENPPAARTTYTAVTVRFYFIGRGTEPQAHSTIISGGSKGRKLIQACEHPQSSAALGVGSHGGLRTSPQSQSTSLAAAS